MSASRGYSPFYLIFHRDPQIALDTLLEDREGVEDPEDFLEIALKRMEISQELVKKRLKITKQKNRDYYDASHHVKECKLQVGDSVYLYNFVRSSKFDKKWIKGYKIIKKTGPVSFLIENTESGQQQRVHADALRLDLEGQQVSPESQLKPKEGSTGSDPDLSDEDIASDSADEDSDATEIYEYVAPPSRSPTPPRRPTRKAKEEAKVKLKYCQPMTANNFQDQLSDALLMMANQLKQNSLNLESNSSNVP